MLKLTDTQLVILSAAATRDGGSVLPLPGKLKLAGDPADVFRDLIKKKLVAEQPADADSHTWRTGEDGQRLMLVVTPTGLRAIGVEGAKVASAPAANIGKGPRRGRSKSKGTSSGNADRRHATTSPLPRARPGTKQAKVIDLLRRPGGASIKEMMKATGWQAHSVRGVMSGMLKKKLRLIITSAEEERGRVYRIAGSSK